MSTTAAGRAESSTGIRSRIRVLVVDDSEDHRTLIARRLGGAGMQVALAGSAGEALDSLERIDLVLLDYRLPGTSGLEVLRAIRARRGAPSVIMVTGAGSMQVAVDAMRAGAINFVVKDRDYLDTLPEVVEGAWRHHDLAARAAELQRLALLVTSAPDRDRLFREIVDGAARLLRAECCALLVDVDGELSPVVVHGRDRRGFRALAARLEHADLGEPHEGDGPWQVEGCLVVPLPSEDGETAGVLMVAPDDGQVAAEERELAEVFASFAGLALRNLRQFELERMLVTELQQTLDARRDFIASVSHELRTPLTSIAGFAATLSAHWGELDDDQRLDLVRRVVRNADDLRELVDELLDLAGTERGRGVALTLQELGLEQQVVRVLEHLEHVLDGRELRVSVPAVEVLADASLLRRTLTNLLSNAVKFSEVGTPIEIAAEVVGPHVRVSVRDHGIGLPAWEASRVFDPFFRARSSVANAVRGSGIGLALVREYVRAMDGEVSVESTPGVGSTFAFTLPLAPTVVDLNDLG
jgi:signal transduction histidine kinase